MEPIGNGGGGASGSSRLHATANSSGDGGGAVIAPPRGYALSGKIMLSSILALFSIVLFVLVIHLYARWYFLRRAAATSTTRRRRRQLLNFAVELNNGSNNNTNNISVACRGLDPGILKLIPISSFSNEGKGMNTVGECAVCLCEFEDSEKVRNLPQCGHGFHVECIDMWFHSHSTCPLCRSPVSAPPPPPLIAEPPAPSRPWSEIRNEVSRRLETEPEGTSGGGSKLFRGRIGSLKRLLSGDLRIYCGGEPDLERGEAAAGERDHHGTPT